MATKIEIVNIALVGLGQPPINDLSDDNPAIVGVSNMYDEIIDDCFASHPWKFAMATETLLVNPAEPATELYSTTFNLPAGFIQTWNTFPQNFNYIIQGNLVYANAPDDWKWTFIKNVSPALFPQYFTLFVAYKLAAEVAMMITQDMNIAQYWAMRADKQLFKAQNRDATQQPNDVIQFNPYWADQYYGGI